MRFLSLTFFACVAAACSSIQPQLAATTGELAVTLSAGEFPGATRLATGFDPRTADRVWESGDEVVFALRLRKGAEVHRWLLHLRVGLGERLVTRLDNHPEHAISVLWETRTWSITATDGGERRELKMSSPMLPVAATVSDEGGKKLTSSIVKLPIRLLGRGVLPAVDRALAADPPVEPAATRTFREDAIRPMVEATIGMMALLNVVQEDDALAEYFWQVVEKPSLWSIVTHLGAAATLSLPFEKSVPATNLPPDLPAPDRAFVVPLQIDVNGSPALFVELVATDAARPYALCGGIVAAVARHPTKPEITFELQLLAARLGAAKAGPTVEATARGKRPDSRP